MCDLRGAGTALRDGVCMGRQGKPAAALSSMWEGNVALAYSGLIYVAVMCHFKSTFWWQAIYQLAIELVIS